MVSRQNIVPWKTAHLSDLARSSLPSTGQTFTSDDVIAGPKNSHALPHKVHGTIPDRIVRGRINSLFRL